MLRGGAVTQLNVTGDDQATEVMEPVPSPVREADAPPSSLLSRLRRNAEAQQADKYIDMAVGGEFGEMLQIRYKPLKPEEMDAFIEGKTDQQLSQMVALTMDMMARSCVGVFSYDPETMVKEELKDSSGSSLYLDNRLADMLQLPQPGGIPMTSREIISCLFGYNGAAISNHGNRLAEWMQDPKASPTPPSPTSG
jgi:hypothetical protein